MLHFIESQTVLLGSLARRASLYLDISVDDLVLVQVSEPLQDLSGVEDNSRLL